MARSSLPSSSPSIPHSDSASVKGNGEGGGGGAEDAAEQKRKRGVDGGEEGNEQEETAAGGVEGSGGSGRSVSPSIAQPPLSLAQQVQGSVRMAPTMVTNVVRPVASTPIPIASKPVEAAVALSSVPQEKKATLLIAGGGAQLPITTGGGYLSSSSSPGPISVTPVGGSSLVTSLVLGGSFPTAQPLQLVTPQPLQPHTQTHPPVLQPTAATSSVTPPSCPKPLAQVQYVLPTESPSSPQLTHQHFLSLPANAALANGMHSGVGIRVSPGTRGETETNDWLSERGKLLSS